MPHVDTPTVRSTPSRFVFRRTFTYPQFGHCLELHKIANAQVEPRRVHKQGDYAATCCGTRHHPENRLLASWYGRVYYGNSREIEH